MRGVWNVSFLRSTAVLLLAGVLASTALFAGCGPKGTEKTGRVSGKLTYKGAALSNAVVTFTPEKGRPGTGETDADGKFSISTFGKDDGAVLGKHKIAITEKPAGGAPAMPGTPEAANAVAPVDRFPAKYKTNEASQLEFEVKAGSNTWDYDLKD